MEVELNAGRPTLIYPEELVVRGNKKLPVIKAQTYMMPYSTTWLPIPQATRH